MVVTGLSRHFRNNAFQYLRPYELHDCNIVIHGYDVATALYRNDAGHNYAFGGDYDFYYRAIVNFFRMLSDCNITPFVILHGNVEEPTLNTAKRRFRYDIRKLERLTWNNAKRILPSFCKHVFVEAMKKCLVPFTTTVSEGIGEIAALSAKLNCPVLTDDSDFYIYDIMVIPFSMLSLTTYEKGQNYKYLKCYIYEMKYLTNATSLSNDMIPLLAVLLGNDYIERSEISAIMRPITSLDRTKDAEGDELYIRKILQWLAHETYSSALEKILGTLETVRKEEVFNLLTVAMESYRIRPCTSYDFFRIHYKEIIYNCTNNLEEEDKKSECNELEKLRIGEETNAHKDPNTDQKISTSFPLWFQEGIALNRIEKYIEILLSLNIIFASPQIEHFFFEDSNTIALSIIRHTFTILHNIEGNDKDRILNPLKTPNKSDANFPYFWYIGRTNVSAKEYSLKCEVGPPPVVPFNPHNPDPKLLQSIFNGLQLDCPELFKNINNIPCDLRLYILAIIYWMHNSRHVNLIHLRSILICLVVLRTVDSNITPIRNINDFDDQFRTYIRDIGSFRSIQQKRESSDKRLQTLCPSDRIKFISKSDCVLVQRNLLNHFHIQDCYRRQYTQYCTPILHVFAEFQSVLYYINGLNGLLKNIYESPKMEQCYCGVFIFNIYELLKSQVGKDHYIQNHIFRDSVIMFDFYKFLWDFCCNLIPSAFKNALPK